MLCHFINLINLPNFKGIPYWERERCILWRNIGAIAQLLAFIRTFVVFPIPQWGIFRSMSCHMGLRIPHMGSLGVVGGLEVFPVFGKAVVPLLLCEGDESICSKVMLIYPLGYPNYK